MRAKPDNHRCVLLPGDIRDRDHCITLVERSVAEFGCLDVLDNNATAQTMNEGLDSIDDDEMRGAFAANVFAINRLAKAAAPYTKPESAIVTCALLASAAGSYKTGAVIAVAVTSRADQLTNG